MASARASLVLLRHGTTRRRAEAILQSGPDPNFKQPGDNQKAEGFSTARLQGPFPFGTPEVLAAGKARLFPDEGGPAIIDIGVPEYIVRKADLRGEVRFDHGAGLEELLAIWSSLSKRITVP